MFEIVKKAGEVVANTASRVSFKIEQNAPTICLVTGIVGIGAAVVFACKATVEAKDIVEESSDEIDRIKRESINGTVVDEEGNVEAKDLTEEEAAQINKVRWTTAYKVAKLYAPWVILLIASEALIVKGQIHLMVQNVSVSAYALGIQKEFDEYRGNVIEEYGEEVDQKLRFKKPVEALKSGDISADGDKECTELSVYSEQFGLTRLYFGPNTSSAWEDNPMYNRRFVDMQFAAANYKGEAQRHLYLNELLDLLYMNRRDEGQDFGYEFEKGDISKIAYKIFEDSKNSAAFWIEISPLTNLRINKRM